MPTRPYLALSLLLAWAVAPAGARAGEEAGATAVEVRESDLALRLGRLASPEMEGRETTQRGADLAAAYVAAEFARAGLTPFGEDGGWFQSYTVPRPVLGEGNRLVATGPGGERSFAVERDWNPLSVSANDAAEGALVFAGYGITAPDRDWDDYAGAEVRGRVVLVLRKDPGWNDVRHAAFLAKLSNAASHGAAALLLCNDPATVGGGEDRIGHWSALLGAPAASGAIPYAFVSQDVARALLAPLGRDLGELEAALRASGPQSAAVEGVHVAVATSVGRAESANAVNVAGWLEGTDPERAEEVVVVGAHYDHVGRGWFGSLGGPGAAGQVHLGADDNASGTSALLELAEHFAAAAHRPARPLLFLAFSGEEMGLLGSAHYVEHPLVPNARIVTMVNLDMVGRSRDGRLQVGGVGTGTGLKEVVAAANEPHALSITWDPQGTAPSDSTSFFLKRIPVLFFFTGLHEDYHRPTDTADRIQYEGLTRIVGLVRDTVRALADRPERVTYTEPPRPPRPARIGIQLAREADPRGVAVGGVRPGGPAGRAGVEAGDVVVALAGQVVRSATDLRDVLGRVKPGKAVELRVLRGEELLVLEITPEDGQGR